jgi:putative peptidoglycan lipid II flippase
MASHSFGRKVLTGAGIISLFVLLGKCLGFVQKLVIADRFGTGFEADAFTFAFTSIIFTAYIVPFKILAPFLPLYAERRERAGEPAAWRFASSVGTILVSVMAVVTVLGIVAAPQLVRAASSFESPETTALATRMVRIMFPAAFLLALFSLLSPLFHADKRFALPAVGETLNKLVAILALLFLFHALGASVLAVGVVAGALVATGLLLGGLGRRLRHVRFRVDWHDPALRTFAFLIPPVVASILVARARDMLDVWFASGMGAGYTSSLNYAKGLADTLIQIVPFTIGVVIYPFFSDMIAEGDRARFTDSLMGAMRMMAFLFVPISAGLVVLREPVVRLAFERGSFTADSVALTAGPLLYYALGLTGFALEIILMRFYFALKNVWTTAWVGVAGVAVHVAIILCLRDLLQHESMALAAAVSKSIKVLVLFVLLRPHVTGLRWRGNVVFGMKTLAAALVMGLVVWVAWGVLSRALPVPSAAGKLVRAAWLAGELGAVTAAGALVFAAAAWGLRIPEAAQALAFVKGLRTRAPAP